MTITEWVYVLGIITGLILGFMVFYPWGHRNGHLKGYQDHRDEVRELKNAADTAKAPGAELEIQAKTSTPDLLPIGLPLLLQDLNQIGRPFPMASPRTHTTAADIAPVIDPRPGHYRPQAAPAKTGARDTVTLPAVNTTGGMRALTDDLIAQIHAGTWPPQEGAQP